MDVLEATSRSAVAPPPDLREFADIIRYQARSQPDVIAMVFEGRETTYAELDRAASRVANGLRAMDPATGTRIAQLDKNSDHFYELLLGAAKGGQVLVPVNYRLAPPELVAIINAAGATALFVGPEYFSIVEQILPELPTVRTVIAMSGDPPKWEDYQSWRDRQAADDPMLPIDPDDVVIQLY